VWVWGWYPPAHVASVREWSSSPQRPPSAPPLLEEEASSGDGFDDLSEPSPTRKRVQLHLPQDTDELVPRHPRAGSTEPPKSILRSSPQDTRARRPMPTSTSADDTQIARSPVHNNSGMLVRCSPLPLLALPFSLTNLARRHRA
jgi:hypothetical protein